MSALRRSPIWPLRYAALLEEAPIRVLLTADDPELGGRIAATLRAGGAEVIEAGAAPLDHAASAARAQAPDARPDILVTAPRTLDPTRITAIATARREGFAAPVVVVTSSGGPRAQLDAYRAGADVVLGGPLDLEEVLLAARSLVPEKG